MDYGLTVRSGAQADIVRIIEWYEEKEEGLGDYFVICLDASLNRNGDGPSFFVFLYRRSASDFGTCKRPRSDSSYGPRPGATFKHGSSGT